jgi:hypothetical protein
MALETVTTVTTLTYEPSESFTTTTTHIWTTIIATLGETVTLGQPLPYAAPSFKYTPSLTPTQTFTVTEYDVWLLGPQGDAWTETIIDVSPTDLGFLNPNYPPGEAIFVVPYPCSGWSCWTAGQRVGLVIGVIIGVLGLLLLLCCLRRLHRQKIWVSHGAHGSSNYERWQDSHPGWGYFGPPQANLLTGRGLRPYVTAPQVEAALRGDGPPPGPAPARGEAQGGESHKEVAKKGARQKLGAWIAG